MQMQIFKRPPVVTPKEWRERWPNFQPAEFACKGCGQIIIANPLLDMLQEMRNRLGQALIVTSGYRSHDYNRRVGGARRSQHPLGKASDLRVAGHDPVEMIRLAVELGAGGIGEYADKGFLHVDVRQRPDNGHIARFGSKKFAHKKAHVS